jgi:hypothetical protein
VTNRPRYRLTRPALPDAVPAAGRASLVIPGVIARREAVRPMSEPINTATLSTGWPKPGRTFRLVVRAIPSER